MPNILEILVALLRGRNRLRRPCSFFSLYSHGSRIARPGRPCYSRAASCDDFRTRSSNIRTCRVTWISIHQNMDEKWLKVALRSVCLMMCALIALELIIAWAMRQRIAARRLANRHEKSKSKPGCRAYAELFLAHGSLFRGHGRIYAL
jgi:hypothetical protein